MPHPETAMPLFELEQYDSGTSRGEALHQLVKDERLPHESLLHLATLGHYEQDRKTGKSLRWVIINDIISAQGNIENMSEQTRDLLQSGSPSAILDWLPSLNREARWSFADMYYTPGDLARTISRLHRSEIVDREQRWNMSRSAALSLWKTMVARTRPDWLKDPTTYCPPTISHTTVYRPGERLARRRVIAHTALSDPFVENIYREAIASGVKGIGPKGKESLRTLLGDEHPELVFKEPKITTQE